MAEIAFAIVLGLAAIMAALIGAQAKKSARDYVFVSAALYGALALAEAMSAPLADALALFVSALAPALLAFAMIARFDKPAHPAIAALVLSLCVVASIASAMSGAAALAFAPLFASVCAIAVMALRGRSLQAGASASAFSFVAAAAGFMAGGRIAFMLFSACGLLGIALASSARVIHLRKADTAIGIGRAR